ncbi:AraC family transcriptional regulator [Aureisphaera galaxeae]|uniref:AraC family transcriptional regulator n=1 Tax=Aureisphaera galaxeae TaxID=1538023 RepID=UPI002350B468|nr:AraC family transcriptional regulator [Aureisphaera galaxeae]MDC8003192.1 AraC family transcriptional regulator [Aureisphaera galaxeae]
MKFPDYFSKNPKFNVLEGRAGKVIEYFHQLDSVKDILLNIEQLFFLYVIEGVVKLQSPEGIFYVTEGHSAIVNKGPYVMSESLSGLNSQFKAYIVFLSEDVLEEFYMNHTPKDLEGDIEAKKVLLLEHASFLKPFVNSISLIFNEYSKSQNYKDLIDIKSKELLHYLSLNDFQGKVYHMLKPVVSDETYQIRQVVSKNYLNNLSMEEWAFLCHMSISTFKRKFKHIYGETPARWIKDKRLEYAEKLLKNGKYKIHQVANKSGFENPATFRNQFFKKYGVLPNEYR